MDEAQPRLDTKTSLAIAVFVVAGGLFVSVLLARGLWATAEAHAAMTGGFDEPRPVPAPPAPR